MTAANYKTVFKVDFKPTIDFYDAMFPIATELPDYPDWMTNGLSITLSNYDDWCSFYLAHNSFMYVREIKKEDSKRPDEKRIQTILDKVVPKLNKREFTRVGLRSWFLTPVEMKFDQLVGIVAEKFVVDNKEIREGICPVPTDCAYSVHFTEADSLVVLRAGPLKRDEVEVQFVPNRNTNVPVKKRGLPAEDLFAEMPAVSLLVDVDVSQTDVKVADVPKVYEAAMQLHTKLSQNISKYVFGLKE